MEIKKSPKANLEDKRLTFIFMGLIVALAILYTAFEWTQREITVHEADNEDFLIEEEIQIDQTFQEETPPPPPEPEEVPEVIEEIKIVEDDVETEEVNFSTEDTKEAVEIKQVVIEEEEEEEEIEEVFLVVEEQPEFPGGMAKLMKYFSDNVRYPVVAAENGIQGRVICQFTVWRDGSIRDIVVVRGVDKSLDKEAVRLIENMPKWKPGKQRGKEVSCKFTVPVSFRLQ
ncbi:MAG: energy transducer TonB [Paludibacteraceae bacterium]|nr:energy transducer TonB [Paludibacteraceae bacterium]MBR6519904.1 energy transducer TonB [Paludibacteraceae bacterium]